MIELKDLTKTFENFTAVDSLNLCIESGEFFADALKGLYAGVIILQL